MLDPTATTIDHGLAGIAAGIDLLLDVTPVNPHDAWEASRACGHREELGLRYRTPSVDPDTVRTELAAVPIERVEDPVLRRLFEAKRTELRTQVRLIEARETTDFLGASLDLYGTADVALLRLAESLLERLPDPPADPALVSAEDFAARSEAEIARYREQLPGFEGRVEVRDDVPSLVVVQRTLIVGADSWIPVERQEALVHHEVGTHLLTAETGGAQPLVLLEQGLAGFEETQEALAVVSEHLIGGLDAERMRTLAGRVVAARCVSDGAGFPEVFGVLHERWGLPERQAWSIAMRVVRGGGFTKDVIYLRGVVELVSYLAGGGAVEPLLVGKLHLLDVPAVEELLGRGVLVPPTVRPHWLDAEGAAQRLAALQEGLHPVSDWPVSA
jgi:uncharacterized protein (TIGR02421 family)